MNPKLTEVLAHVVETVLGVVLIIVFKEKNGDALNKKKK